MNILKFFPKPAIFLLPVAVILLALAIFSLFKKEKKEEEEIVPSLPSSVPTSSQPSPLAQKEKKGNLFLILTILLLLSSLPLAILLVKQRQEIRMKAETAKKAASEPEKKPPPHQFSWCPNIKIYQGDPAWTPLKLEELSNLSVGETIRITVKGDPDLFDKARIRINSMEWGAENETTRQKPDSPGEFYIECNIGLAQGKATICGISANADDSFKIEAELHNKKTDQWQ